MHLYTDGACSGNPGPGGWGFVVTQQDQPQVERSGGDALTTNNRMELMATIRALQYVQEQRPDHLDAVQLTTDSQYVRRGITEWIKTWVRKQWRTAQGAFVKNQDLWRQLHALNQSLCVEWHWVKSHSGCAGNERADQLAREAAALHKGEKCEHSDTVQ